MKNETSKAITYLSQRKLEKTKDWDQGLSTKNPLKSWRKPKNKNICVNQTKNPLKYSNGNKLFKNLENN